MSTKIDLPSGAEFEITLLPWEEALKIKQNILRVAGKLDLKINLSEVQDLLKADISKIQGPICAILSSQEIIDSAKICWKKCLYKGVKIDSMSFESVEARGDFLFCVFYAIKENIAPFFGSLTSFFSKK